MRLHLVDGNLRHPLVGLGVFCHASVTRRLGHFGDGQRVDWAFGDGAGVSAGVSAAAIAAATSSAGRGTSEVFSTSFLLRCSASCC